MPDGLSVLPPLIKAHLAGIVEDTGAAAFELVSELRAVREVAGRATAAARELAATEQDDPEATLQLDRFRAYVDVRLVEMDERQAVIDGLAKAVKEIVGVADEIQESARSSKILSVNAAIEAARVGSGGGGFMAVAAAARAEAQKSTESAEQLLTVVSGMHETIRKQFERSSQAVSAEKELLTSIVDRMSATLAAQAEKRRQQEEGLATLAEINAELSMRLSDAVTGVMFQDIVRQRVEAVDKMVDRLGETDVDPDEVASTVGYHMSSQRQVHDAVLSDDELEEEDDGPAIELF